MKAKEDPQKEWLETWYTKEGTRLTQKTRFEKFLKWSGKTPYELVQEFEQKKARDLILKFQNFLKNDIILEKGARKGEKGLSDNAVRSTVNAVRAFYTSQCETVKGLKKKILSVQKAKGEHAFSISDLQKIWHISDTRDKAIISVGCSLGWEASAFLNMERPFFESLVKRARSEDLEFIAFEWQREKTGAEQYGILTPCALDSLERWLQHEHIKQKKGLWNGLTQDGLNKILKRLTKEANITTIGRVRWHLLRKWLMNTLSRNGLNEWQVKIILGKSISTSDLTYLQSIKQDAFDKFKLAYPLNMSLVSYSNNHAKDESLREITLRLARVLAELIEKDKAKHGRVELEPISTTKAYTTEAEDTLNEVQQIIKSLETE